MQYTTSNPEETKKIAASIAAENMVAQKTSDQALVITLSGELGAGKTTFVQGFATALGITDKILSPTFILTRQYPVPNQDRILYHIDLYRLEDPNQIESLGLNEIISNPKNIVLIEWPERLAQNIERIDAKQIIIKNILKNEERLIEVS